MTVPTPIQQRIRILDARGVSWRRIAREVGVSRQTVRKYAQLEDCSPEPPVRAESRSKLDPYKPLIDKWLEADRFMPRKQRHTARRVYDRLVAEQGFDGSYPIVQRYVKRWRQEHRVPGEGYLELEWSPGVMQVDFGLAQAVIAGNRTDVHCLVVSFPHSNMRYAVALPGENAECVCEGLRVVFDHAGVAPLVMVFDNATGAGHRVAWNGITVVDVFQRFVEHARRPHYRLKVPVGDLFADERACMQRLPSEPFDACRWEVRKADKVGVVEVDSHRYLAGPSWRGWTLDVGLRAFDVEIRTQDGRTVARLPRAYGSDHGTVRDPACLLPALARKTRAWGESPIRGDFPDKLRLAIDAQDSKQRRRTFRLIAKAADASGFKAATAAAEHLVEQGHGIDEASLMAMSRRIAAGETPRTTPVPDLHDYDRFMRPAPARKEA